jgi:tetratricopeptide (TPR) repeat protein
VDDLHFADDASLGMLLTAMAATEPQGTRWLFARRPAEGGAAATRLADALEETRGAVSLQLAPLSTSAMAELVDSLGLEGLDGQALAAELVRHTGGNPLFALETLKARWLQGPSARGMPRPASVGALIERRLRQLSPEALALARVAAVAGVDFDIDVAERLLGCSALALADRWAELEAAQVLRDDAFAHDLVFEATLRTLPRPVAARLHGDLAALLEARGSEPARVAEHWRASGLALRAVPHLVSAAEQALGRYQAATAGDHFMAAADALQQAGQRAEAFSMLKRCADAWADFADVSRTEALHRRMQALATDAAELAQVALVAARLHELAGNYDSALTLAREAVGQAERSGDRELLATGLTYAYEALYWKGQTDEALSTAQRVREIWATLGRAREVACADYTIGVAEHGRGRFDLAEAAHERSAPWIMAHGDGALVAHHLRERGLLQLDLGRFEAAEQSISSALQWLARAEAGSDLWRGCLSRLATVLRHRGRYARALALLGEFAQRYADTPRASSWWDAGIERGLLMLALGRADLALQALHALPSSQGDAQVKTVRQHMLRCALVQVGAMPRAELGTCTPPREARMAVAFNRAHARLLPAAERATAMAKLAAAADQLGMVAEALGIRAEQLHALVEAGRLAETQALAEQLAAGLAQREALVHQPLAWWALHGAWAGPDPARAGAALDRAMGWLAEALDHHVPPAFRYGVMQRHPVNRAILAAAASVPAWAVRCRHWQALAETGA